MRRLVTAALLAAVAALAVPALAGAATRPVAATAVTPAAAFTGPHRCGETAIYDVTANALTSCSEAHKVARAVEKTLTPKVSGYRWNCWIDSVNHELVRCVDRRNHRVGLTGKLS
jgi:hypothetical protein